MHLERTASSYKTEFLFPLPPNSWRTFFMYFIFCTIARHNTHARFRISGCFYSELIAWKDMRKMFLLYYESRTSHLHSRIQLFVHLVGRYFLIAFLFLYFPLHCSLRMFTWMCSIFTHIIFIIFLKCYKCATFCVWQIAYTPGFLIVRKLLISWVPKSLTTKFCFLWVHYN